MFYLFFALDHSAHVFSFCDAARSFVLVPSQRKGPGAVVSGAFNPAPTDVSADADSGAGSSSKHKKAADASGSLRVPSAASSSAPPADGTASAETAQIFVQTQAASAAGLSALLGYDDSDD